MKFAANVSRKRMLSASCSLLLPVNHVVWLSNALLICSTKEISRQWLISALFCSQNIHRHSKTMELLLDKYRARILKILLEESQHGMSPSGQVLALEDL